MGEFDILCNAASVGIIGGADGPTAIFITGDIRTAALGILALGIFIVTAAAAALRRK